MVEFLLRFYPVILAIVAVLTVVVNSVALYLQRRRDSVDEQSHRWDAASKVAAAATNMMAPLEKRMEELAKEQTHNRELVTSQANQIENLQKQYNEARLELRAIHADRDQLLQRVLILQDENQRLKQDVLTIRGENGQFKQELIISRSENVQLRSEVNLLHSQLAQTGLNFQNENKILKQEIATVQVENAKLRLELLAMQKENTQLRAEVNSLRLQVQSMKSSGSGGEERET